MTSPEDPGPLQSTRPAAPTEPWQVPAPPPPAQASGPPPAQAYGQQAYGQQPYGQQAYGQQVPPPRGPEQPMPAPPAADLYARPTGPVGRIRPTGLTMLLFFITLGIWGFVYYYQVQEEMKRHSGEGIGGLIALLIALFFGVVSPFVLSHEVGGLYTRTGRRPPVTALTGLWYFPGILLLVGPFIWFVQTNRALNDYWAGLGAR
ncbi:DUF4234 domain-containing protein [Geodermatophilus sp. SYSU D00766]